VLQDGRNLEKLPEGKVEEKDRRNMYGTKEGRECGIKKRSDKETYR
jgi:hypothetical protein